MKGLGTAFVIGVVGDTALAVTAAHVLKELRVVGARESNFRDLLAARGANPGFESFIERVIGERECDGESDCVSLPDFVEPVDNDVDVGLILAARRAQSRHALSHVFPLKLVPPEPGEQVIIAGYSRHTKIEGGEEPPSSHLFSYVAQTIKAQVLSAEASVGGVGRGPSFGVDYEVEGAMSGAPVFCVRDERLYVCGVVSSSGYDDRTIVAAIWPVLGLGVTSCISGISAKRSVLDLIHAGVVRVFGSEAEQFEVVKHGDGWSTVRGRNRKVRTRRRRDRERRARNLLLRFYAAGKDRSAALATVVTLEGLSLRLSAAAVRSWRCRTAALGFARGNQRAGLHFGRPTLE